MSNDDRQFERLETRARLLIAELDDLPAVLGTTFERGRDAAFNEPMLTCRTYVDERVGRVGVEVRRLLSDRDVDAHLHAGSRSWWQWQIFL